MACAILNYEVVQNSTEEKGNPTENVGRLNLIGEWGLTARLTVWLKVQRAGGGRNDRNMVEKKKTRIQQEIPLDEHWSTTEFTMGVINHLGHTTPTCWLKKAPISEKDGKAIEKEPRRSGRLAANGYNPQFGRKCLTHPKR